MEFEWDPAKALSNWRKHKVLFEDAATIFADPNHLTIYDVDHSETEDRYISIGRDFLGEVVVIVYTYRVSVAGEVVRVISARKADRGEELVYYEQG